MFYIEMDKSYNIIIVALNLQLLSEDYKKVKIFLIIVLWLDIKMVFSIIYMLEYVLRCRIINNLYKEKGYFGREIN